MSSGLPHVRSLIQVRKTTRGSQRRGKSSAEAATAAARQDHQPQLTTHYYVSNLAPQSAERFASLIRGHWGGCEIRNHWVRDALFDEDRTRSKNLNLNGNLAVLRCAIITLKSRLIPHLPWPVIHELANHRPSLSFDLLCNNRFK